MEKIVKVQKEEKDAELKTSFLIQELWYLIYLHVEETKLEEKKGRLYIFSGQAAINDAIYSQTFWRKKFRWRILQSRQL